MPVYVDVEPDTYNPSLEAFAAAIGAAHARRSSPPTASATRSTRPGVEALCREHDLVLIEDCCDALGSRIGGRHGRARSAHAATYSFYPAHHMTTGEGGAVATRRPDVGARARLAARVGPRLLVPARRQRRLRAPLRRPLRRRCPAGYDHKYVFSHVGFNFKVTDMQAALGVAQLDRLEGFARAPARELRAPARRACGRSRSSSCCRARCPERRSVLVRLSRSRCARAAPQQRRRLQLFLLEQRIDSRLLLAGNMTRQPGFQGREHRVAGHAGRGRPDHRGRALGGLPPGLSAPMIDWITECVTNWLEKR